MNAAKVSPPPVEDRLTKLEQMVNRLIIDSTYQAKQIADNKKNDSLTVVRLNAVSANNVVTQNELTKLTAKIKADSIKTITAIKALTPLTRFVNDSTLTWREFKVVYARMKVDSVKDAAAINLLTSLQRFRRDSIDQWLAIKQLQGTSPVTQIPLMQSDIKTIKSKNLVQDKMISGMEGSIQNLTDTFAVFLKVVPSSDFGLDSTGKFGISKSGVERIKAQLQQ